MNFSLSATLNQSSESLYPVVVFLIGSVLVVFVNAAALLVELILKARTGQRTVDLRLIVIPTEIVFAVFLFAVQISVYCFHVQGPSGPLTVQLGDSVKLPCFVETPLPMEDLEVEWKRTDSGSLVHLWQNGESRPESQNQRYHERAHFFSEEVAHGNFSLLLTNVTPEDAGVYKCVVHTNQVSNETLIKIMEIERLIVSGGHVISAYVGEEITLNCSVDSHIPSEKIEEVSWKKQDEDLLLLLYQEGEILTESTHGRFKDRVEFFSAEDRNKGNFSMRLKDVRIEDKGLYMCLAFSGTLSDNTTVEVQQLGFSSVHIGIIVLCLLGFVFELILGILSYSSLKKKDGHLAVQCALVLCLNITLFIGFILWGVTDGLFTEAATCSALNSVRICFLFWIAFHLKSFKDDVHQLITFLAGPLQYFMIITVVYIPVIVDVWHKVNTAGKVFMLIFFLPGPVSTILPVTVFFWFHCRNKKAPLGVLLLFLFLKGLEFLFLPFFTITVYNAVKVEERDALICVTVFLIILSVMNISFYYISTLNQSSDKEKKKSSQPNHEHDLQNLPSSPISPLQRKICDHEIPVLVIGSVLVVFVNAVALLVELILKAGTGQRTVDLRLIVIPTEIVFALCVIAVQITVYCKEKKTSQPNHEHELQNLAPAPELSGS
ncbi:uncharacterized protein LOC124389266 [Silurus meridionalis]|uniref:uncharacterized protein LOC124389266 n=1 Tax=Silurus meridionalis TaxID=175797 RepID=UPI001EEB38DA|nr:uncharacterized protein LOC124389266 [Silurus meridionalis]